MSNIKESLSEFSGEIKNQLRSELDHGTILIRWGIMAAVIGFVVGGIANDKIFRTLDLYFSGEITKDEALKRLKFEKPNNQYCFRTIEAIKCLKFVLSSPIYK